MWLSTTVLSIRKQSIDNEPVSIHLDISRSFIHRSVSGRISRIVPCSVECEGDSAFLNRTNARQVGESLAEKPIAGNSPGVTASTVALSGYCQYSARALRNQMMMNCQDLQPQHPAIPDAGPAPQTVSTTASQTRVVRKNRIYLAEHCGSLACHILLVCFFFGRTLKITNLRGFFTSSLSFFLLYQSIICFRTGTS